VYLYEGGTHEKDVDHHRIAAKNEFVNQDMERWKTLWTSTNLSQDILGEEVD